MRGALDAVAGATATLTFFGDARAIAPLIGGTEHDAIHAPRALEVDDPLRATLRGSVDSSMHAAIRAVAGGDADAAVSGGSTGGLMALSRHLIGTLPGIRRPAIVKTLAGEGCAPIPDAGPRRQHRRRASAAASIRIDGLGCRRRRRRAAARHRPAQHRLGTPQRAFFRTRRRPAFGRRCAPVLLGLHRTGPHVRLGAGRGGGGWLCRQHRPEGGGRRGAHGALPARPRAGRRTYGRGFRPLPWPSGCNGFEKRTIRSATTAPRCSASTA